jgi:CubicO group peptidase (beta-lactamase class C family)
VKITPPTPTCDQSVDAALGQAPWGIPAFGVGDPKTSAAVDAKVESFLSQRAASGPPVGGAVLTVTHAGKLLLARSYGYSDATTLEYMEPDSRMRVAGVSKTITAMAILKMVHDGQVTGLNAAPFTFLELGRPFANGVPDTTGAFKTVAPEATAGLSSATFSTPFTVLGQGGLNPLLNQITLLELLQHTGGWNRNLVLEPYEGIWTISATTPSLVSQSLGLTESPPTAQHILQFMLNQPLQFAPGSNLAYSNTGYAVLGEVLAQVGRTHDSAVTTYEDYVQKQILKPLGMNETTAGRTLAAQRQDREASYVSYMAGPPGAAALVTLPPSPSVYPNDPIKLEYPPYGGLDAGAGVDIDVYTGFGSWVTSALDLARFTGAIESHNLTMFAGPPTGWPDDYYQVSASQPAYQQSVLPSGATDWMGAGWDGIHVETTDAGWQKKGEFGATSTDTNIYDWEKNGGFPGTLSEILITYDGYTLSVIFNFDYPGSPGTDVDNLLWAVHDAVVETPPSAGTDLFSAYDGTYTAWEDPPTFKATLAAAVEKKESVTRVDGESVGRRTLPQCSPAQLKAGLCDSPVTVDVQRFRARLSTASSTVGATRVETNLTCAQLLSELTATSPPPTQVLSVQRFYNSVANASVYQAVFASP